ncbi:L-2-amino-thiazoline-4-carboxylic acid hydrolase [Peptoniphilus stercorisuis]|uniref:ArsR family transcriptional regulator n=1 Tax=Peptoniphilus stercorisuis TaxID=1436965 RepID=A0ABS4KDS9_9FIRM|nr:L-2-amino-thiazoline-4-carboxylic acid hydrolase [Peptoniphilus stercorisuis]MBP2025918.1 putative ArsR family transcriptional regulator [Peptoniphilus stercorisuis]
MSIIKNETTIDDEEIIALRNAFAQRARWMKLFIDEMKAQGIDWETAARNAIGNYGESTGKNYQNQMEGPGLSDLHNFVCAKWSKKVFEADIIEDNEDHYHFNFHHCPLVTGWQMEGCSDEEIKCLCDIAMDGDRGIARGLDNVKFTLGKTIAEGHDCCEIAFDRIKK